jgi:excisionase family DNA binding protein
MTSKPAVLPQPTDDDEILSDDCWDVARAAQFLGIARSTVYRWAEAGLLPHRKIGPGRYAPLRFIPSELRAWRGTQPGKAL